MAFMLALRAVSAATELALAAVDETMLTTGEDEETATVPATALVDWVPLTVPPVELT
jgi:hypothetical protein